jgi:ATP/ADP translocase/HEAT repeat protein
MSAYLLLIITCYTATKAVRDSLFIIEIGPTRLPYLYVLTAVSMAVISSIYPRALKRLGLSFFVQLTSLIAVASLLLFWSLVAVQGQASFYALYVWVSLFGAITASQAWSVASHVFDAREARRSFAWIGVGGVVGGILGGSLARVIAPWLGTEILLPICAALMGVTILILRRLAPGEDRENGREPRTEAGTSADSGLAVLGQIRKSPYLSMMVTLLLAGVLVEAFIDYEFKVVAHQAFDSKDRLTSFFGTIASYGGMLALLIQTLVTNRLLKHFGVGVAIVILPAALLTGFLLVSAWPALWAVSILKLIDGSLSYSVHRSGMELLYVPIPAKLRASVKALIDLLVDRAGRAAGGLLLLLLTAGLSFSIPSLSLVAVAALSVWLGIAIAVRRNYVHAFRTALERKVIEPEALEVEALDSSIVDTLIQALSSPDDRQVLYALDLLGRTHPSRWHSYLPVLLQHRSSAIRSRTIALLTEWKAPSASLVTERLSDPELEVRIEAVRHLSVVASSEAGTKLKEFLVHADSRIVLAAIHCMGKYQVGDRNLIDAQLIEWALNTGEHSISARTAAARALSMRRFPGADQFLERLLDDPEREVVQQAVRTAAEIHYEPAIPRLISMLARAPLRREARNALLKLGDPALAELRRRLEDDQTPLEVRTRIPKVLAFSGDPRVAGFLLGLVHRFGRQLDMRLLRAVNRMHATRPDIAFEPESVSALIRVECEKHRRLMQIRRALGARDGSGIGDETSKVISLMKKAIDERLADTVERVFRLLALIYSPADMQTVYFNFSVRPAFRASAVEFLDNLIDSELRALVMPLVEEPPENGTLEGATNGEELLQEEAIQILLTHEDEWLRTIAKELAAKMNMDAWRPRIA